MRWVSYLWDFEEMTKERKRNVMGQHHIDRERLKCRNWLKLNRYYTSVSVVEDIKKTNGDEFKEMQIATQWK